MTFPATAEFPFWFGGSSEAHGADRGYPLAALRESDAQGGEHAAPLSEADQQLLARIQAGDVVAFELLYRTHAEGLLGFAYRLCGSRPVAQDVVADLFAHLWERREEWRPSSGLRAYLFTAVRHRVSDQARAEHRADVRAGRVVADPSLTPLSIAPDMAVEVRDDLTAVWHVVETFPPLRRQVMYLRWARGLTPAEIATVVGLNRNAVDKHLSRAVQAIRDAVGYLREDK